MSKGPSKTEPRQTEPRAPGLPRRRTGPSGGRGGSDRGALCGGSDKSRVWPQREYRDGWFSLPLSAGGCWRCCHTGCLLPPLRRPPRWVAVAVRVVLIDIYRYLSLPFRRDCSAPELRGQQTGGGGNGDGVGGHDRNPPANPPGAVMAVNKNKRLHLLLSANETVSPPTSGSAAMCGAGLGPGRCGSSAEGSYPAPRWAAPHLGELPRTSGGRPAVTGGHPPTPPPSHLAAPRQAWGS